MIKRPFIPFFDSREKAREQSKELQARITTFLSENPNLLVIIADPDTDVIVAGFQDKLVAHRLMEKSTSKSVGVVSDVLKYSQDEAERRKDAVNQFLLMVDGSIYTIAKQIAGPNSPAPERKVEDSKENERNDKG